MKVRSSDPVLAAKDSLKFESSLFSLSQSGKENQRTEDTSGINTKSAEKTGDNIKKSCYDAVLCLHCGYRWRPKIQNPKACPACKQYRRKGHRREFKIKIID